MQVFILIVYGNVTSFRLREEVNEVKDIMVKNIGELLVESKATPKNAESVLKLIDRQ